ncbi:MAG: TfoX/Sxy family protein [Paracoccus sp. (in: a-proteobacteria)]|uniref:TfoX/Sxy family protein n=1 Tax=Paracoccus sp. TaxID=267 RepID=UPI0026E0F144|nr:TfoX/Sxy family protein [Paracoccus sp. (in: a-proteobacteria)]MDO5620223.1 TfoX/Sxy family protein [Paracoccus sp. (in: a-proteobacteria)]
MNTSAGTCADIVAQMMVSPDVSGQDAPGQMTARKMFGEYSPSYGGLLFGPICDDRLYLKPVSAPRAASIEPSEAPPCPKAKPYLLADPEDMADLTPLARLGTLVLAGIRRVCVPRTDAYDAV